MKNYLLPIITKLVIAILMPFMGMGQLLRDYNCGTWKELPPEITEWATIDTIGNKPTKTFKRNWVESGWQDVSDQWTTLEFNPCGKNIPQKYRMYRVCSITGIRQERKKTINYEYIPKPKSDYDKVIDSIVESIPLVIPGTGSITSDFPSNWIVKNDSIIVDTTSITIHHSGNVLTYKPCEYMVNGKCYQLTDTIPVIVGIQYTNRDATILREAYLINGEPWYRSPAPLTRGKWIKIRCIRWKVEKDWITNKK